MKQDEDEYDYVYLRSIKSEVHKTDDGAVRISRIDGKVIAFERWIFATTEHALGYDIWKGEEARCRANSFSQ